MERILVLQGGSSSEREVSLRSAANVIAHLQVLGHAVTVADPAEEDFNLEKLVHEADVVFPILHGEGGEDGVLQAQLEKLQVPFLGAGSKACEVTFDKAYYRRFMSENGVLMAQGELVDYAAFNHSELRSKPYVLKPVDGGSSVDTVILHDLSREPDDSFFRNIFKRHSYMLLEELMVGQELTVGVLGDEPLPVILIVPPQGEEFDYANKYNGRTQEIVNPPQVAPELQRKAKDLALHLHRLTQCKNLSRSDMILTAEGDLYVLETNTMPGMTEQSLFPQMAAAVGLDMTALTARFVELAKGL